MLAFENFRVPYFLTFGATFLDCIFENFRISVLLNFSCHVLRESIALSETNVLGSSATVVFFQVLCLLEKLHLQAFLGTFQI